MLTEPCLFRETSCIRLSADGATVVVALHGANVLSWRPADARERLFLSERAVFDGKTAIRGGIPVIFPQFADRGDLPKHGFARTSSWQFEGVAGGEAIFALGEDATGNWPHAFLARLHIALSATRLTVSLQVTNTGSTALAFTAALHTYLRVDDIAHASVDGLQGLEYEDSRDGGSLHRQLEPVLRFDGEIDRIYRHVIAPLVLRDGTSSLTIAQDGFADAVVWNPGTRLAASIADLSPGDESRFACAEAGQVSQPVTLEPRDSWMGSQILG